MSNIFFLIVLQLFTFVFSQNQLIFKNLRVFDPNGGVISNISKAINLGNRNTSEAGKYVEKETKVNMGNSSDKPTDEDSSTKASESTSTGATADASTSTSTSTSAGTSTEATKNENAIKNLRATETPKSPRQLRKELIDNAFLELMQMVDKELNETGMVPMEKYDPNISLVIPVAFDDLRSFPILLSVLRMQTMRPEEIILILDFAEEEVEARARAIEEVKKYSGSLRNLRAFFRTPPPPPNHRAGSNRLFGASKAKNEIVVFFDSDDLIHPQRIEYISKAFNSNKDMDAFLTEYFVVQMDTTEQVKEMPNKSMEYLKTKFDLNKIEKEGGLLKNSYEEEYNEARKAVKEYGLKCPWDPNDRRTEINWPETHGWWLYCCHNGWLTVKRSVLIEVPYPDKISGEDSLFVFRLLMSKKNLGHSKVPLGIYVLGNTYEVR